MRWSVSSRHLTFELTGWPPQVAIRAERNGAVLNDGLGIFDHQRNSALIKPQNACTNQQCAKYKGYGGQYKACGLYCDQGGHTAKR